ncbi:hypothetical protein J132_02931 [Termitomyces sp. J132]|nr:hypothetical protein H2248_012217 [Termitomyces sp. 'cryptogamus']KNZ72504.1 hypothetical protein J132_02931 [Termitomyces sp. J132]
MPGKHVRFAEKNIIHSPPTFSPFSPLTSPYAPLTPPSPSNSLPSSPFIPPPFLRPAITPPRIHPLLQFHRIPILNFDLRQPPSAITSNHQRLSRQILYEPATSPPLRSLTIIIPDLPWTVTVRASHEYVTIQDVLDELYYSLRRNISAREFHALPNDQARRKVAMAYEQRYRRITSPREYEDEKRLGVIRVDFLMGRNKFLGLSLTSGPDCFHLHTG